MGTCGQPGYVFREFCLKQGIDFIIFCLNQGIDFINFCLKQGIFSWTINSLCLCSTLNRVSKIGWFCLKQGRKISDFCPKTGSEYEGPGRTSPPKDISSTPREPDTQRHQNRIQEDFLLLFPSCQFLCLCIYFLSTKRWFPGHRCFLGYREYKFW